MLQHVVYLAKKSKTLLENFFLLIVCLRSVELYVCTTGCLCSLIQPNLNMKKSAFALTAGLRFSLLHLSLTTNGNWFESIPKDHERIQVTMIQ